MIILLGGANGAGKDTYAKTFASCIQNSTILSIAQPIKDEYARTNGFPVLQFNDRAFKESVRPALIALGDARRQQDRHYWIRQVAIPKTNTVIISDFRFYCEYAYLREHYGQTHVIVPILIQRLGYDINHTDVPDSVFAYTLQNQSVSEHPQQVACLLERIVMPQLHPGVSVEPGAG